MQRIGKVRKRLAEMLEEKVPGLSVDPSDLLVNYYYNSKYFDACSWSGYGSRNKHWDTHFCSWDTMTDLVRYGFEFLEDGPNHELFQGYELCTKRKNNQRSNRAILNEDTKIEVIS